MSFTKRDCVESKGVQFCVHNYRKLVAVRTGLMFSTPPEMFSILNAHHFSRQNKPRLPTRQQMQRAGLRIPGLTTPKLLCTHAKSCFTRQN